MCVCVFVVGNRIKFYDRSNVIVAIEWKYKSKKMVEWKFWVCAFNVVITMANECRLTTTGIECYEILSRSSKRTRIRTFAQMQKKLYQKWKFLSLSLSLSLSFSFLYLSGPLRLSFPTTSSIRKKTWETVWEVSKLYIDSKLIINLNIFVDKINKWNVTKPNLKYIMNRMKDLHFSCKPNNKERKRQKTRINQMKE